MTQFDPNHFEYFFSQNPSPTLICNGETKTFTAINPAALEYYGYSPNEWSVLPLDALFVDPEFSQALTKLYENRVWNRARVWKQVSRTKQILENKIDVFPLRYKGTESYLLIVEDATARIELEQKYRETKEGLNRIFENLVIGVYQSSPKGQFISANRAFAKMLGYTSSQELISCVTNIDDQFYVNPTLRACFKELLSKYGEAQNLEFEARRRDGSSIWLSVSVRAVPNNEGKPIYYEGFVQDVTEKKRYELSLKESEERFYRLSQAAFEGLLLISEGKIVEVNSSFLKMTGYRREQVVGRAVIDFIRRVESAAHDDEFYEVVVQGEQREYHGIELRTKYLPFDGKEIEVAALRDVSARKMGEQKIKAYADELARSNRELETFAYIASHDLREPLRMVSSFLELIKNDYQDKIDQRGKDFIEFAMGGAMRMSRRIEDLLAFCRAGRRGSEKALSNANTVFKEALTDLTVSIAETSASISHDPLPWVAVSPSHLAGIFQNLLTNGIRFRRSDPPNIFVSAQPKGPYWVFTVKDNGIGIKPEDQKKIFQLFQHGLSYFQSGSGIGLSLCKKVVESYSGAIWVESSELGVGSTLAFSLPAAAPPESLSGGMLPR